MVNDLLGATDKLSAALDEAVSFLPPSVRALILALKFMEASLEVLNSLLDVFWNILSLIEERDNSDHVSDNSDSLLLTLLESLLVAFGSVFLSLDGSLLGELEEVEVGLDLLNLLEELGLGLDFLDLLFVEDDFLLLRLLLEVGDD